MGRFDREFFKLNRVFIKFSSTVRNQFFHNPNWPFVFQSISKSMYGTKNYKPSMPTTLLNRINSELKVFDLRSDTFTKPGDEMRKAMFEAEVGDAVFNEDPTKIALEKKAADIFGKEDAVFLTSGTMGNLVSILVHCNIRNSEIIVGSKSHIVLYEQVGAAQFGGVNVREIENTNDGTFSISELKKKIRTCDFFEPNTRLVCVENTHNMLGGKVLPISWLDELVNYANSVNIPLHMDGARIFNAAIHLRVPVSRIVQGFDSVSFCLSKSLGCPYGSVLLGSKHFITQARKVVKGLGGGSRQIGFMAAAGLYALDNMISRHQDDHDLIQAIANVIRESNHPFINVDSATEIHSNILMVYLDNTKITTGEFLHKLQTVDKEEPTKVIIKAMSIDDRTIRLVAHCSVPKSGTSYILDKIQYIVTNSFS